MLFLLLLLCLCCAGIVFFYFYLKGKRGGQRVAYTQQANEAAAEVTEKEEEKATDARPRREKRMGALDVSMGAGSSFSAAGGQEASAVTKKTTVSNNPVLDLNSALRGKKVRVVQGEDDVAGCYLLVVRVLNKYAGGRGSDLRTSITAVVHKSHSMHLPVTALVEVVIAPNSQSEAQLQETAKKVIRRVAVENPENGRREFTSKYVACALGVTPEELGLWTRLDMDRDYGVALSALYSDQLRTLSDVKTCRAALSALIDHFAARQLGAVLTDERIYARVGRGASAMVCMQEAEQSRKLAHARARVLEERVVQSLPLQLGANGHPNWARRAQLLAPCALEAAGFTPRPLFTLFTLFPVALAGCPGSPYESEEAVREAIATTGACHGDDETT
ncbi:hypothetical protein Ctob_016635 [Chrysochromulina tobinii]|uniref:Uncharacterized protein n=1 Tax=Chrysochromulina tobinii TaxID=1460289 RepID=A0A0M0LQW4_9EUKA|nr:hypothetical protein Ctob_016635 [Chrysochromulina tobinii]|eukprot:KOO53429.1 hypothetical protein Ctob_016635 [Chrysochromulina sp. CCMP291]